MPDISRYQWLYVLAGNATGYEANIEYVSDTKIKYRVGTYITSMDIYGIGRA